MRVTLKDVARLANVGTTTASRVINNPEAVRPETRARVLDAIRRLNYRPNIAAQMLIKGQEVATPPPIDAISLVLGADVSFWSAYWAPLITLLMDELKKFGFQVIVGPTFTEDGDPIHGGVSSQLRLGLGIIVVGEAPDPYLKQFADFGNPVVVVDALGRVDGVDYVLADNAEGVRKATLHLAHLGHQRIGLITGSATSQFARRMEQGYRLGLDDAKLQFDSRLISRGDFRAAGGHAAMGRLLLLDRPPTAVVSNDEMSIGAMEVIRENGLNVPGDISMIGFDGLNVAQHLDPPLTTLRTPKEALARLAIQRLRDALRDGADHVSTKTMLPVDLVERESTRAFNPEVGDWRFEDRSLMNLDQSIWNTNAWFQEMQSGPVITYRWQMEFLATSAPWGPAGGLHILASDPTEHSRGDSYLIFQDREAVRIYKAHFDLTEMASFPAGARAGRSYEYQVTVDTASGRIEVWRDGTRLGEWTDDAPIKSGRYISVRTNRTSVSVHNIKVSDEG